MEEAHIANQIYAQQKLWEKSDADRDSAKGRGEILVTKISDHRPPAWTEGKSLEMAEVLIHL